jgi:DNA-binding Lrp family transcriptional regulator
MTVMPLRDKLDDVDRRIVNELQGGFPLCERPYAAAAAELGLTEEELIRRLKRLLELGAATRFGPLYNVERMGGAVMLAALAVPEARFEDVAEIVNSYQEVAHNYRRSHRFNMWFVLAAESQERIDAVIREIEARTGLKVLRAPKLKEFYIGFRLTA